MRRALVPALLIALAVSAFATELDLKQAVRERLIERPYLRAGWVRVAATRRTVTLRGHVPDEELLRLVVLTVRNTPGVRLVKDDLAIDPSLEKWTPTTVERARIRLDGARRIVRGDAELGQYTTLHVTRTRTGVRVSGAVSTTKERRRIRELLSVWRDATVSVDVAVRPDAPRASLAPPVKDDATLAFVRSVEARIAREPLLAGKVSILASVQEDALVLRGTASDLVAHDLAVEIATSALRARQRDAERAKARSGELTRLLAGDPGRVAGVVPGRVESLVFVGDPSETLRR